ncbi:GNAT family N-acetyltransferase [Streptomyces sp. NPDC096079]|uniref:GNAT family N-acetyltransferase n=1 Tax=Streptomyces sp. NPDC096079 TaxID=3155820 RepID=UPI00332DE716
MVTLETSRLVLRRWREEDVAPMAAVNGDPEVMRWIRDGGVRDERQTRDGIRAWESEWEAEGFGLFAVEIRSTGELAGFTGLSVPRFLPEVLPAVEIGWRLGRAHWGAGLATEAARAVVRFGFEERGLDRIVSTRMRPGSPPGSGTRRLLPPRRSPAGEVEKAAECNPGVQSPGCPSHHPRPG